VFLYNTETQLPATWISKNADLATDDPDSIVNPWRLVGTDWSGREMRELVLRWRRWFAE